MQVDDPFETALELLTAFLNTLDVDQGTDELADGAGAGRWLAEHGLVPAPVVLDDRQLAVAVELREALRDLAGANHEGQPDPAAAERFSAVARRLPLHAAADPNGRVGLAPGGDGVDAATAEIAGAVIEVAMGGAWPRVKICPADDCAWGFVDRSKNRSRRWCAMGVCGNRQKTRAYRERHRDAPGTGADAAGSGADAAPS